MTDDRDRSARVAAASLPARSSRDTQSDLELALDGLPVGGLLHHAIDDHSFTFVATNQDGDHSGRRRYCVVCSTCEKLVHEATTAPIKLAKAHAREPRTR